MVSGHLQIKKGYYYMVLNIKEGGIWKGKWIATGLLVKNNKKKAEDLLYETRKNYKPEVATVEGSMLFVDLMANWLKAQKRKVEGTTYNGYAHYVNSSIIPFFKKEKLTVSTITQKHIQRYCDVRCERVKVVTVKKAFRCIRSALQMLVDKGHISRNPALGIEFGREERFTAKFYNQEEVDTIIAYSKGTKLEIPILLASFYGLRRGEVVGLRWHSIDFQRNVFTINHIVTGYTEQGGGSVIIEKDGAKTESSVRTLPLVAPIKARLLELKEEQIGNRKLAKKSYSKEYLEYICVDEVGVRIKPNYLTARFPVFLEQHGLRRIRFHDLRHSCASLLLANGVSLKQIQEWLGHSTFKLTADTYAHLEVDSKIMSAAALSDSFFAINDENERTLGENERTVLEENIKNRL